MPEGELPVKRSSKLPTSFHLSADCKRLLKGLADRLGLSQAAVIEMLTRERARKEGLE